MHICTICFFPMDEHEDECDCGQRHFPLNEAYNPERDIGLPEVTWVDWTLLEMIKDLQNEVKELKATITAAEGSQNQILWTRIKNQPE